MKTHGLSDYTIKWTGKALVYLSKHCDLDNPGVVRYYIARLQSSNGYKHNLQLAYDKYAKFHGIKWTPTKYRRQSKTIRLPTTKQLEILIANARPIMSVKLRLSMETGLRPVELCNLRVSQIDMETRTIYPDTAKHGAPRSLRARMQVLKLSYVSYF